MFLEYKPEDYVINPKYKNREIDRIQSINNNKITDNFENVGKQVLNGNKIILEKINNIE